MNHPLVIQLTIAYTLVGAFVFTVGVTCLSLVGWIRFADARQQNRLFAVLIVELVTMGLGSFSNFLTFNPVRVAKEVGTAAIVEDQERTSMVLETRKGGFVTTVQAAGDWQDKGVRVKPGDTIDIKYVSGQWNPCGPPSGCPWVNADGWKAWTGHDSILDDCPHAALLFRISEGEPVCARGSIRMTVKESGTIQLRINDTVTHDNIGSIVVSIIVS